MSFNEWAGMVGILWGAMIVTAVVTFYICKKKADGDYDIAYEHGKTDEWSAIVSHIDKLQEDSLKSIEVYESKAMTLEDVSYEIFHEFHDKHRPLSKYSTEVAPEDVIEVVDV